MSTDNYNIEAKYYVNEYYRQLDDHLIDKLWCLFEKICGYWKLTDDTSLWKSSFLVFISNRIETDLRYLAEYVNFGEVMDELKGELGEDPAYVRLFTDKLATIIPATTKLARARQLVSNEFIALALSLGGFRTFGRDDIPDGMPLNYQGYIGGMNREGNITYRTYNDE